jgi:hypothetical protein
MTLGLGVAKVLYKRKNLGEVDLENTIDEVRTLLEMSARKNGCLQVFPH